MVAVEFAIVLVPLLLIAFGITEFGRALFQYNTLAKSVRDASRYLTTVGPGDATAQSEATCLAVYGNKACAGSPLVPNLTTAMISICDSVSCPATHLNVATGSGTMSLVTVTLDSAAGGGMFFNSLMPMVMPDINFGAINVTMQQSFF